ncbi:hypothetical protein B0H19DRAFT_1080138 [Mycena capillaripes]|nr:hypothetical protein B0H19DRAFT_1080138 [Mycena capillaripes]
MMHAPLLVGGAGGRVASGKDESLMAMTLAVDGWCRGVTVQFPWLLSCHESSDVCMGLDWKASVQEWLIGLRVALLCWHCQLLKTSTYMFQLWAYKLLRSVKKLRFYMKCVSRKELDLELLRRPDYDSLRACDSDSPVSEVDVGTTDFNETAMDEVATDLEFLETTQNCAQVVYLSREDLLQSHPWTPIVLLPLFHVTRLKFSIATGIDGILFAPDGIGSDNDWDTVLACKSCSSAPKKNKIPRLALANYNFLGPISLELQELTVMEEAMIARCRAQC